MPERWGRTLSSSTRPSASTSSMIATSAWSGLYELLVMTSLLPGWGPQGGTSQG